MEIHRIELCEFQRKEDDDFEVGLLLNEGELGIIDMNGKQTGDVWTWNRCRSFELSIGPIIKEEQGNLSQMGVRKLMKKK